MDVFELQMTATHVYKCCAKCERPAITAPNTEVWLICENKIIFMCVVLCDECLGASSFIFSCSLQSVKASLDIHPRKRQHQARRKKVKLANNHLLHDTVSKNFLPSTYEQEKDYIRGLSLPWWCK